MTTDFEQAFNDTLYKSFDTGFYIGMMSGTSLDGMDAALCQFDDSAHDAEHDTPPTDVSKTKIADTIATEHTKIIAKHSVDFPPYLREVLLALCHPNGYCHLNDLSKKLALEYPPQSELDWFGWASREYAEFASQVIDELLEKSEVAAESVLAIGCHGQTVRHRPHLGFSLQLVDPNIIAERTGISVVTDFRRRDMAVGGQGAPLVPAFHLAHFGKPLQQSHTFDHTEQIANHLVVVNLGGIANITVLPAGEQDKTIGYDTGPANVLLDSWYQFHVKHSNLLANKLDYHTLYDQSGEWAQTGNVNQSLLQQLLKHPYFSQPAPKSTGREDFNIEWLQQQINHVQADIGEDITAADVQATLTQFTVTTLSDAIKAESKRLDLDGGDIIVCGGGGYNEHLLELLRYELTDWHIFTSNDFGIAPTWVEAMAFAWLAQQTIMGKTGNLPAATGASKPVVLGQVCFA